MRFDERAGNRIEFLREGENYFERLRQLLDDVRTAKAAAGTYVRLAFWEIDHTLELPDGRTIEAWLKRVADAGHTVEVIMWCPARLDVYFDKSMSTSIFETNKKTADAIGGYDATNGSGGKIRVLLEVYNGWNGSSVHQKIVLASIAGRLEALLGGLNLTPFYYDDDEHSGDLGGGMGCDELGHTIHDTAVQIAGPAAVDVETEWLRRYQKRFYETQLSGNAGAGTDPPDGDPTDYDTLPRATASEQKISDGELHAVRIATTNSEGYLLRETDIQSLLVERIRAARRYIYLEGFVISDPTLVYELRQRMRRSNPPRLIVFVPKPYSENPYPFDYLNYISAVKIGLDTCSSVKVAGTWIKRDACSSWKVVEAWNGWSTLTSIRSMMGNGWMQDDTFEYTLNGKTTSVRLSEIEDFADAVTFYAPHVAIERKSTGIYIHSKLALFDDEVAVVGSANFSYRSQVYDGEISAFISGDVSGIRKDLFKHWGLRGEVSQFDEDVQNRPSEARWVEALDVKTYPKLSPLDKKDRTLAEYARISHTFI